MSQFNNSLLDYFKTGCVFISAEEVIESLDLPACLTFFCKKLVGSVFS